MLLFQSLLVLLVCAVLLAACARRFNLPYPSLLALGGTALAFVPNAPSINLDPQLTLALFVAPALLDAAFDTSLRDLKRYWIPVMALVFVAVGLTTAAVAWLVHSMVPDMPWAAAIAIGAIVAPPDAVAASAVMRRLNIPHRVVVILEGESLLNDATALLIYRLAVTATMGATQKRPRSLAWNEITSTRQACRHNATKVFSNTRRLCSVLRNSSPREVFTSVTWNRGLARRSSSKVAK
jgi:CPA1 family monovalent cation:H+ antiporter